MKALAFAFQVLHQGSIDTHVQHHHHCDDVCPARLMLRAFPTSGRFHNPRRSLRSGSRSCNHQALATCQLWRASLFPAIVPGIAFTAATINALLR